MLIVMRNTMGVVIGRDQNGDAMLPMPTVMLAVGQELDATACRFLGTVRCLHEEWKGKS